MAWYTFWRKSEPVPEKPKLKICCACPETKRARDECVTLHGPEAPECAELIEAHKACLREAGFKDKRDKVTQVASITNASTRVATDCLAASGWDTSAAINYFFSVVGQGSGGGGARLDRAAIRALFGKYRDAGSEDSMMAEGVSQFLEDLGVEPEDPVTLVVSYYFQAATMGEFTRTEFEQGMLRLQCDSLDALRAALPGLRKQLDDPTKFPAIYNFAYGFSLEKQIKCLPQDVAVAMWQLLLPPARWRYTGQWCDFLQRAHNRAISRDTWMQLLDFIRTTKPDFSNYDDAGAWPYLIDEFVADMREKGYGPKSTE